MICKALLVHSVHRMAFLSTQRFSKNNNNSKRTIDWFVLKLRNRSWKKSKWTQLWLPSHIFRRIDLSNVEVNFIILLPEKFLPFDWLRAEVFQLNLKYLNVKITVTMVTQNHQIISSHELRKNGGKIARFWNQEIQELKENSENQNTEKSISTWLNVWTSWAENKNFKTNLLA